MIKPATPNAYEYLTRALQLLEKPRKNQLHSWIKNAEAITADGTYCEPEDERADAWCTIGAIKAVTKYDDNPDAAYRYCLSVLNAANPMYVAEGSQHAQPTLNDYVADFSLIQRLFQRGIAMAARLSGVDK